MKNKLLVAALAASVMGASSLAKADYFKSDDGETGGYIELGTTFNGHSGVDASYRGEKARAWELGDDVGAKLQLGYDWGKVRFDFKLTGGYGNLDKVHGVSPTNDSEYGVATGTFNLYWDIYRFALGSQDGTFKFGLTPYIGGGVGGAGVSLSGKRASDDAGSTGDNKYQVGAGGHGTLGLLIDITQNIGLTAAYDYATYNMSGGDSLTDHAAEVGLRLSF